MTDGGNRVMPETLRARLAGDFGPVRPIGSPLARTLWMVPLAAVLLVAAPLWFNLRVDAGQLGLAWSFGASALQIAVGLMLVTAAMREAVPGRQWSRPALALWFVLPMALVVSVTLASWSISPVLLRREWLWIGFLCFTGSVTSAFPAVLLGALLVERAFPTRRDITGMLLGLGAGLMADAGWRLFCHFSEPTHVLATHLAGVAAAAAMGVAVVRGWPGRSA